MTELTTDDLRKLAEKWPDKFSMDNLENGSLFSNMSPKVRTWLVHGLCHEIAAEAGFKLCEEPTGTRDDVHGYRDCWRWSIRGIEGGSYEGPNDYPTIIDAACAVADLRATEELDAWDDYDYSP